MLNTDRLDLQNLLELSRLGLKQNHHLLESEEGWPEPCEDFGPRLDLEPDWLYPRPLHQE